MVADYLSSQLDWAGYQVSTKWGGRSMRTSGVAAASTQPSDPSVRGKQQVLFTIRITTYSTSALSTTSVSPSTGSLLLLGLSVTEMTML